MKTVMVRIMVRMKNRMMETSWWMVMVSVDRRFWIKSCLCVC